MTAFTILELRQLMLSTADGAGLELDGDFLDVPFPDLGLDSLAVLELATRVQQDYHLVIPDEAVAELTTPRDLLDYVAQRLRESV